MTILEIREALGARVLSGEEWLNKEVHTACGSDMMSDVLAFVKDQAVLLTGLCNPQVIRTAEMMDIVCIVFVRNKKPDEEMIRLAESREGVMQIELEFVEGNARARHLYEKMGFRITGVRPNAICLKDGTLLNEYMMIREITR